MGLKKSQEIRQKICFDLLRKYKIHDGIVQETSDEGFSVITIWRKLSEYFTLWYLRREPCVIDITESYVNNVGFKTQIVVGIAKVAI